MPAGYSGFESAVVNVGGYLRDRGWRVVVYCQVPGSGAIRTDRYDGFHRVLISEPRDGIIGRARYDLVATRHAVRQHRDGDVCLTFGYNTGILGILQRHRHIPHVVNMDGMDWQRSRYGPVRQAALWTNEVIAGCLATRLIADHPVIADYLGRRYGPSRVRMVPYGADAVTSAPTEPVTELNLDPGRYAMVICRPIPENSVLDIVAAWSKQPRGMPLVVLGEYRGTGRYERAVRTAAGSEVIFPGPIYDPERVGALRHHSSLYVHGHTVGGTNPSLVEAMAAGTPVLARDNAYNRWVAGDCAWYFDDPDQLESMITRLLAQTEIRATLAAAARARHSVSFTTEQIGSSYQAVLEECL